MIVGNVTVATINSIKRGRDAQQASTYLEKLAIERLTGGQRVRHDELPGKQCVCVVAATHSQNCFYAEIDGTATVRGNVTGAWREVND